MGLPARLRTVIMPNGRYNPSNGEYPPGRDDWVVDHDVVSVLQPFATAMNYVNENYPSEISRSVWMFSVMVSARVSRVNSIVAAILVNVKRKYGQPTDQYLRTTFQLRNIDSLIESVLAVTMTPYNMSDVAVASLRNLAPPDQDVFLAETIYNVLAHNHPTDRDYARYREFALLVLSAVDHSANGYMCNYLNSLLLE